MNTADCPGSNVVDAALVQVPAGLINDWQTGLLAAPAGAVGASAGATAVNV